MADKWAIEARPSGVLTPIDPEPILQADESTVQHYKTTNGKVHCKRVERGGHTTWYMRLEG